MTTVRHKFVEFIPRELDEGVVYVSQEYGTASHKCCCGCGKEVVTPLSPTDWKVSVERGLVSLKPSIGNWSFPCRSHYWITKGRIIWAEQWSQEEIEAGRRLDTALKDRYYNHSKTEPSNEASGSEQPSARKVPDMPTSLLLKLRKWLS